MDYLSLSRGGKFEDAKQPKVGWAVYPYTGPERLRVHADGALRRARAVRAQRAGDPRGPGRGARRGLSRRRSSSSGGISTFEQAEALLRDGAADIVASARQTLADPDWFRKMRLGRGDEVRRCVFTNYCEGLDQMHKQVTCKLWDHLELEGDDSPRTADGRRRLVAPAWEPAAQ